MPPTTDYDENSTEVQAITVLLPQQEVTIINTYHPDNSDINLDLLNTLLDIKSDTKILLGDLNAKSPSWDPQKYLSIGKSSKLLIINQHTKKADIPTNIISSSGRDAATNKETASLLAKHYENNSKLTFNANDRKLLRTYRKTIQDSKRYNHKNIFTIPFLMEELEAAIAKLHPGQAPGPDFIFGRLVQPFGNLAKKNYWKFLNFHGLLANCPKSGNFPPSFQF
ncbi:hypothetical protein TNCV_2361371 [Trichonephila clavipes]|nr:hypothetical protein TNCV_2361371 [Trichonephila clavipes]